MIAQTYPPNWTPDQTFADGRIGLSIQDDIAVLAIQIPRKMNSLDAQATQGMLEALAAAQDHVRALIFTGVGGKSFISGADIGGFDDKKHRSSNFLEAQTVLAKYPVPTIAAIRGYCIGGGLMTALNCDFRLASTDARFGIPAARLGLAYGYDGLARLIEVAGPAKARRLLYVGDLVDAQTALSWGLVEHLYAPEHLWDEALAMAQKIARNAPFSVLATKLTVAQILTDADQRDLSEVNALAAQCYASRDFREGRDAFREKRNPNFKGI
jgi:enoyl-CoA hydratase/carnithine racemase